MITDFQIRLATREDVIEFQRIIHASSRDWNRETVLSCFAPNYLHWMIGLGNTMMGCAIVRKVMDYWEIMQIVIDAHYQQQGLGANLLRHIISEAKNAKIKKLELEVRESNYVAFNFYRHVGFKKVGVRKKYYGGIEDAILMDYDILVCTSDTAPNQ
ncbi:MAG: ribosomal-protein-alanine N-acetyltransferase [Gammaproteobacteria bacterium RIFCSPHIGHO2_02_FULL_39_13]|nr:MAG: ribosomal-protein-alanine N-acetyltransferase [Gammaproteobacteria bacterium RIFCSPHIGHO2_02_FULL_39_13]OGT50439.1 MAG: ribosomal-protein-alanine N-acetyltransferase [Gammaproteobacteria bacterium RIFCSPHIGHO2_12_FULL_39_24]